MTDRRRPTGRRLGLSVTAVALLVAGVIAGCAGPAPSTGSPGTTRSPGAPTSPIATPGRTSDAIAGRQRFTQLRSDSGPILQTTLVGAASGVTMPVWVWLPPQYDEPAYAHTAFPALMLYPGGTGADRNAWVGTGLGGRELVAAGARNGTLTPFILVMPSMQLNPDLDTECADLPGNPKVGTFLAVDVRKMVEDNFRVRTDRDGWGAAGTSSGAYCATRLVFDHPDQYAAVASIGGYFSIETTLAGADDPSVRSGDPASVAVTSPPDVSVLLYTGDGRDLKDAQRFLATLRPPTHAQLQVLPGGQHLTVDFAKMIPGTLAFLTAHLGHPTPEPETGVGR
jgi:hypothetical protein